MQSIVFFSAAGDVSFAKIPCLQYFPKVVSDSLQNLSAVARF